MILYIFSMSETVFEIFWKKPFLKKLCQMLLFPKTSWLWSNNVFFFVFFSYCWKSSLPWTARSRVRKISGGGLFSRFFSPLFLKNCWTYQNEHGSIRLSLAPFFSFTFISFLSVFVAKVSSYQRVPRTYPSNNWFRIQLFPTDLQTNTCFKGFLHSQTFRGAVKLVTESSQKVWGHWSHDGYGFIMRGIQTWSRSFPAWIAVRSQLSSCVSLFVHLAKSFNP